MILKPKLWNRSMIENQPKYSKSVKISDGKTKSNFIKLSDSLSNELHNCVIEGGFFNSRRFRSCFFLNPNASFGFSRLALSTPMEPFANTVQLCTVHEISSPERIQTIRQNCLLYLEVQLELTEFSNSKLGLPILRPKKGNELIRRFFQTTLQIRNSIGNDIHFTLYFK